MLMNPILNVNHLPTYLVSFAIISDPCHYAANGSRMLGKWLPFHNKRYITNQALTFTIIRNKLAHLLVRK